MRVILSKAAFRSTLLDFLQLLGCAELHEPRPCCQAPRAFVIHVLHASPSTFVAAPAVQLTMIGDGVRNCAATRDLAHETKRCNECPPDECLEPKARLYFQI